LFHLGAENKTKPDVLAAATAGVPEPAVVATRASAISVALEAVRQALASDVAGVDAVGIFDGLCASYAHACPPVVDASGRLMDAALSRLYKLASQGQNVSPAVLSASLTLFARDVGVLAGSGAPFYFRFVCGVVR